MKKFLLVSCLVLIAVQGFAQQFSQYNTGTLYDSFENPSEPAFTPDTSKHYAFNFFIPNFNGDFFLRGNAQTTLVKRAFNGYYDNTLLQIGNGQYNIANANANAYFLMFKLFGSLKGNSEIGFFAETKSEGKGKLSDESIALFNGPQIFPANTYDNIFNDHYYYQIYNAIGFTYRENLTKRLAVGFKLAMLLGIDYNKLDIYESHISFDRANDAAALSIRGKYYERKGPGNFDSQSFLPSNRSPGVQFSIGSSYITDSKIVVQANLKDVGFIHWYSFSGISNFNATETIQKLSARTREDSIYHAVSRLIGLQNRLQSYSSPTDAKFELSASKSYWLNYDDDFKYIPTLIGSKEILYNGFTAALVNRLQYRKFYNFTLTAAYDNYDLFSLGTQLMYKAPNFEVYLGSERLLETAKLAGSIKNGSAYTNGSYTGANIFLGFSIKFGPVIEHPMNASVIPIGQKGFLGRLWARLFKTYE